MPYLIKKGEQKIRYGENPKTVISYFGNNFPFTGHGSLVLARALMEQGRFQDAEKVARISWLNQQFSNNEFLLMIENFGEILSQSHRIRLENLLWNKSRESILQMEEVVSKQEFLRAKTRLNIQKSTRETSKSIKFPKDHWKDPGAVWDLVNRFQDQKKYNEVSKILDEISKSSSHLGMPSKWKSLRIFHTRRALRLGKIKTAYQLASSHFIEPNHFTNNDGEKVRKDYVELEWLSGFIALNFLKKPEIAESHFARVIKLARKQVNLSKIYYWYGRSLVQLNRSKEAKTAFEVGSRNTSTFYGQLSAERIKKKDVSINQVSDHEFNCKSESIIQNEIVKVGILLLKADRIVLGVRFFKHAAETLENNERVCLLKLLYDLENWSGVIAVAKKFIQEEEVMFQYSYPILDLVQDKLKAPLSLVYATIRQESEFYSAASSRTGALGLMQVMPKTAKYLAKRVGLKYEKNRMLKDKYYNIKLGTQYLTELLRSFRGSIVLSIAAYNAGPGTVKKWIKSYGDPRNKGIDPLIWIEMIPYTETRNYVMHVLGNELVYRSILSRDPIKFDRAKKNFGHKF